MRFSFLIVTWLLCISFFTSICTAAPADPSLKTFTQPDGSTFIGFIRGDEHSSWIVTTEGYTVSRESNPSNSRSLGLWLYVSRFDLDGTPILTSVRADLAPPSHINKSIQPPPRSNPNSPRSPSRVSSAMVNPNNLGPSSGSLLFILVEFDDQLGTTSEASWATLLNKTSDYFDKASYGAARLTAANEQSGINNGVIDWVNIGSTHPDTGNNFSAVNEQLTIDALNASNLYVDYSQFDHNSDGVVTSDELSIVLILAGNEAATSGPSPSVWGHVSCIFELSPPTLDGVVVSSCDGGWGYSQFGEIQQGHQATMGIIVHELGHLTYSLPDLYDIDGSSEGVNLFGFMGTGSWGMSASNNYIGETPVMPSAWTKYKLGWTTPTEEFGSHSLSPSGSNYANKSNTTLISARSGNEYFLVENRQQIGYDEGLWLWSRNSDFCGLAIWHIDDSQNSNQYDTDRWVDLEEADRSEDDHPYETDLFFSNSKNFSDNTTPSARLKNGSFSGFNLDNISDCVIGNEMTFRFLSTDSEPPLATITSPNLPDATVASNFVLRGTATDTGGSGINSLEVAIKRTDGSNDWYNFNGQFSSDVVRQTANLSNTTPTSTNWNLPIALPAGDYRVHVVVFDGARNNSGWVTQDFVVSIADTIKPTTNITTPNQSNAMLPANFVLMGNALDTGGSGIDSIEVAIKRTGTDNDWYNFNGQFSSTVERQNANLSNITLTSANWNLPVSLPAGNYRVHVIVFDKARNNSGWEKQDFVVSIADTIKPTTNITTPNQPNVILPATFVLKGNATDTGGSGFDSVELAIRRTGANSQWYDFNGGLSSTPTRMEATLSNITATATNWSLPVTLPPGNYRVQVLIFDGARNNSGWIRRDFVVATPDTIDPTGTITTPSADGIVRSLSSTLVGNASDTGGSGFDSVEIAIRRTGANSQWFDFNGGFSNTATRINATLSNTTTTTTNWRLPITLPPGEYRVQALIFDGARNNSGWIRRDFVVAAPDIIDPTGSITTPSSDGVTRPLSSTIVGNASDTGGSGFDSVEIAIRRTGANSQWFDFNGGFSDTATRANTTLSNTTTTSTNWSLPVTLPPGNYRVQALVFDQARNNSGWIRRDFIVK